MRLHFPAGDYRSRRIENRIPGADTNPYLSIALTFACILLGIREKIEPAKPMVKESDNLHTLPRNLDMALDSLDKAKKLKEVLGLDFISVFNEVKRAEAEAFLKVISPWEREYLLLNV